ncbi:MAG: hypothetical protein U0L49_09970 [Eubacterium sp.]|nr:hypothetical protein [Eubacterium sp.]
MKRKFIFKAVILSLVLTSAGCGSASASSASGSSAPEPEALEEVMETSAESISEDTESVKADSETEAESLITQSTVTSSAEEEQIFPAIGREDENALRIKISNAAGSEITGFSVAEGEGEYGANLLEGEDSFKADETRTLYFQNPEQAADAGEHILCNVKLTFADGTEAVLHDFPFLTGKDLVIKMEAGIAYLEYTNSADGSVMNTLIAEQQIYADQKAAAEQAAAEQAAADEAARQAAAAQAYEQQVPDVSAQQKAAAEQAAAEQNNIPEAGCVGDDALTY